MLISGIDEAGRGPVIGPMVVAGVAIDVSKEEALREMGVKDSKMLSEKRREELFDKIKALADKIEVVIFSAKQIDDLRQLMSLNKVESRSFVKIIDALKTDEVYIDLPENSTKFVPELKAALSYSPKVIAEHKADAKYPVVSAASIIAKVTRDRRVKDIEKKIGMEFGSGYPSDPRTKAFLGEYMKTHDALPDFVRHSWATVDKYLKKKSQKTLSGF